MGWTLVCVLYMRYSLERTVKEKVSTYVDRHIITRLLGIGVHNDIKKKIRWGTEMCIIWMFQNKGMIRYQLGVEILKVFPFSQLVIALPANYR